MVLLVYLGLIGQGGKVGDALPVQTAEDTTMEERLKALQSV